MLESPLKPKVWTVSEVNRLVKELLEQTTLPMWLRGEVSNLTIHGSGHVYFSLKDKLGQIAIVFFRGAAIARQLQLREGLEVEVHGRLTVYEPRGTYQMQITQLRLCGKGTLQEQFDKLKAALAAEGLFDPQRKRPIPAMPKCVGIVTSAEGAALQDFLHIANRRNSGLHIRVVPASVQGKNAVPEIVAALQWLNANQACEVIVLARGGGSLEDLWAFNEEPVARAIAASAIPVISAIGHEVDYTIADFVADLRAPTPSAAAEIVVARRIDLLETLKAQRQRLQDLIGLRLSQERRRLERLASSPALRDPTVLVRERQQRLDDAESRLARTMERQTEALRYRLEHLATRLQARSPRNDLEQRRQRLATVAKSLEQAMRQRRLASASEVERLAGQLQALSPRQVLSRGYSILRRQETGGVIASVAGVAPGDKLQALVADGTLDLGVDAVRPEEA